MYEPTQIAERIEKERQDYRISVRSAARKAGISESRWRQIAKGYVQVTKDVRAPVNAPVDTLAKMAAALEMTAGQFLHSDPSGRLSEKFISEFKDALEELNPTFASFHGPVFGGSYEDPEYLGNIEEWLTELSNRMQKLEERVAYLEPDSNADPDYSDMSEEEAFEMGLAAKKGDEDIGHDEPPHQP